MSYQGNHAQNILSSHKSRKKQGALNKAIQFTSDHAFDIIDVEKSREGTESIIDSSKGSIEHRNDQD